MRNAKIDIEGDMDTLMKELREREERGEPAPTSYDVGRNGYTPVGGRHARKTARPGKCVCGCLLRLVQLRRGATRLVRGLVPGLTADRRGALDWCLEIILSREPDHHDRHIVLGVAVVHRLVQELPEHALLARRLALLGERRALFAGERGGAAAVELLREPRA